MTGVLSFVLFTPGMVERGWGRVMNVASTAAFQPGPLMAVYYATKAYVLSFQEDAGRRNRRRGRIQSHDGGQAGLHPGAQEPSHGAVDQVLTESPGQADGQAFAGARSLVLVERAPDEHGVVVPELVAEDVGCCGVEGDVAAIARYRALAVQNPSLAVTTESVSMPKKQSDWQKPMRRRGGGTAAVSHLIPIVSLVSCPERIGSAE